MAHFFLHVYCLDGRLQDVVRNRKFDRIWNHRQTSNFCACCIWPVAVARYTMSNLADLLQVVAMMHVNL